MSLPETMNAMVLTGHGDMDMLVWNKDWPRPDPERGEVLIRVGAAGLNNTDVNTRSGWYSKTVTGATTGGANKSVDDDGAGSWGGSALAFPRIQGADMVGKVVALGDSVDPALMGRRVVVDCTLRDPDAPMNRDATGYIGSERDGGFAQYCTVPVRNVRAISSNLSDAEIATFPCSYSTAEGMISRAEVGPGDIVLVTGASGGVGSALIQLAKRRGARVVALASRSKHAALVPLGVDALLDRDPGPIGAALEASIGQRVVSVVADVVGGPIFPRLIEAIERGGRYVTSGAIAGPIVDLDLRTLYLRDLTFLGSTVTSPQVFPDLVGYIERGELSPILAATYPLEGLHDAQQAFIDKRHTGNIVVIP